MNLLLVLIMVSRYQAFSTQPSTKTTPTNTSSPLDTPSLPTPTNTTSPSSTSTSAPPSSVQPTLSAEWTASPQTTSSSTTRTSSMQFQALSLFEKTRTPDIRSETPSRKTPPTGLDSLLRSRSPRSRSRMGSMWVERLLVCSRRVCR